MARTLATPAAEPAPIVRPRSGGLRRLAFPLFALAMLALPALPVPDFWITQSNYIGLYALVAFVLAAGLAATSGW